MRKADFFKSTHDHKQIRVLHLLEATLGGTGRHISDLLSGLNQDYADDIELHLGYSLRRADSKFEPALRSLESAGVRCFQCDMARSISLKSDIDAVLQVAQYAKNYQIDIIHTHSAKAGYVGRLASKFSSRTQSVYTPHSSPFRLSTSYHLLEVLAGWMMSDAIIAVSESEKHELIINKICPKEKVRVINHGVPDVENQYSVNDDPIARKEETYVVGTVGRLTPQKAPHRFVQIAEQTLAKFPEARFVWMGDGEMREEIEQLILMKGLAEKVCITGWLDNIDRALLSLDVFLLASDYEALSYAPIEAMRAGLPCILSNVTGSTDLVEDAETGFLIQLDNIDGYVRSIHQLLTNVQLRNVMGQAGRKRWHEKFQRTSMVSNTVQLYYELLPKNLSIKEGKAILQKL